MKIIRALKMRIYPNDEQKVKIDKTLGTCRFIYNHMLARNQKVYERRKEHLSNYEMQSLLPVMKNYLPWMKEVDSQALKRMRCSDNRILSNPDFKYATVSRQNGKYYVSITYSIEKTVHPVALSESQALGLDYKSDGLYVDSNGNMAGMPKWFRDSQAKLKKEQRKLRNKVGSQKGETKSHGYLKQLQKVRNLHEYIANQRLDYLHKESTRLADQYDAILIEDLDMKAIANKGFGNGKATLDNGWSMFTIMLDYKMTERGKHLQKIDRWFPSSQTCSICGCVNKDVKNLSIRKWTCPHCGAEHDRDVNAAINIKQEGLRLLNEAGYSIKNVR